MFRPKQLFTPLFILAVLIISCNNKKPLIEKDESNENEKNNTLFVFVGEKIEVKELPPDTTNYFLIDGKFSARYKILQRVYGNYNDDEIEFTAYDHYGTPDFSNYKNSLLFVSKRNGKFYHEKYQFHSVYKTKDNRWAGAYSVHDFGQDGKRNKSVQPQKIDFAEEVSYPLSLVEKDEIDCWFPEPYYKISGDKAIALYGNYIEDLFRIKKEGVLSARGLFGNRNPNDIDKNQHPIGFYQAIKNAYGDLKDETTFKNWAKDIMQQTMIFNDAKWASFMANPDANVLQNDPAFAYASAFVKNYNTKYSPIYKAFTDKNAELGKSYLKGIMEMNPAAAAKMYPDANFSMRLTYGNVKSYRPRDGVIYDYVCTSKGLLEKYVPGDYEFDLPAKQIELLKKKDFGQYIDKSRNDLVVSFITTNDITGGNSGSPVMDGSGNLIGLAFDGNYEALSHKIAFDKDLNRTICVDVRYVLWCIDKLGGASNLISELKLVKQ